MQIKNNDFIGMSLKMALLTAFYAKPLSEIRVYDSSKHNKRICVAYDLYAGGNYKSCSLAVFGEADEYLEAPIKKVKFDAGITCLYI